MMKYELTTGAGGTKKVEGGSMDPVSAGIMAGGGLAGGLLSAKAQKEQARRQRVLDALGKEMEGKQAAARQLQQGTQQGIAQLMSGFGSALGR